MITVRTIAAWGYRTPGHTNLRQIVVRLSDEIFQDLKARAIKENTSMQEKLRDYVQVGLEVDRDWDAEEPDRHSAVGQ